MSWQISVKLDELWKTFPFSFLKSYFLSNNCVDFSSFCPCLFMEICHCDGKVNFIRTLLLVFLCLWKLQVLIFFSCSCKVNTGTNLNQSQFYHQNKGFIHISISNICSSISTDKLNWITLIWNSHSVRRLLSSRNQNSIYNKENWNKIISKLLLTGKVFSFLV